MAERVGRLVRIEGRVQGVGYRAWLANRAVAAGLDGWVRNRRDGSVEALLYGPPPYVHALIAACRDGPALAHVLSIGEQTADGPVEAGFKVRPTH